MITLDRAKTAVSYDPETGIFTWLYRDDMPSRWNTMYAGKCAFTSIDQRGYFQGSIDNKAVTPHRLAWTFANGEMPHQIVDHVNGVKTDNRASNLRLATVRQNQQNAGSHGGSSSFCGVSFHRRDKRWQAYIVADGKHKHLGMFRYEIEAARAYDAAAIIHHGAFARLNLPQETQHEDV